MMKEKGQSLIELLLAISIMAILLPALIVGIVSSRQGKVQQNQRIEAVNVLKQTEEALRSVRESGWNNFSTNGTFHPVVSGSAWVLASGTSSSNGFTTQVVISDVYRDVSGAIVLASASGTLDPSTKRADITISWTQPYSSSLNSLIYIARTENSSYTQTTTADFNTGTKTNTEVVSTSGGEVILGAGGGGGDWCVPSKSITTVDLPKSGVANAISAIEGRIFAGTGDNSSGVSFANVPITITDPPVASVAATFDGYKTNTVFGENNYAYLGTDNNSKEVVIIDLTQYSNPPTNSKYLELGSINAPGNTQGNTIYVVNNKAYVVAGNKFYIYDITTRSGAHNTALNSGLTLSGTGMKVIINGSTAFVVTNATNNQLQIINISNPASPSITDQVTLSGGAGRDLYVSPSNARIYVATAGSSSQREFFIVDGDPSSLTYKQVKGSYDTNGMDPKGVTVVTGNKGIIVGTGGTHQYQVISLSPNEASPSMCASLSYATGVNGVASVLQSNGYAYSYIITGDASSELKIILGGAGGQYSSAGTFESGIFDVTSVGLTSTVFNRINPTFSQPSQTTIRFQVAVANAVNNSCSGATYTYIGPNKTSNLSDTFSSASAIPVFSSGAYQNPGRCFRYKTYFTSSDVTQTPELYDFTVNFSP